MYIKTKKFILFIFILLLFKPVWLLNIDSIGDDELSYWLHSATLAFDYDIDYSNDYDAIESWTFNNSNVPSHPPGSGYLSSLFVYLVDLFFEKEFDPIKNRLNPVGSFWILGYLMATLFYCCWGMYLLKSTLSRISNNNKLINLVLIATFLSSLSNYVLNRFMLSHSIEFFLVCAILYNLTKNEINLYFIVSLYFLLNLTRPTTFVISLLFLFVFSKNLKKNKLDFKFFMFLFFVVGFYLYVANRLYSTYFIFTNSYRDNPVETLFKNETVLDILFDIPSLFFSPSMGLLFISPIIFLSVVLIVANFKKDSILKLLIILGGVIIVLLWQGKDVTFGQRFLIGQLPFAAIVILENSKKRKFISWYLYITIFISYLGNLYLYSSENLTLKPGTNLFGQYSNLSLQNYFINLPLELLNIEVTLSMFSRTIFFIILIKIFTLDNLLELLNPIFVLDINSERYQTLKSYSDIYEAYEPSKFLFLILLLLIFSYFTAGIFTKSKRNV